ncbi:hypothetical protein OIV83_006066 [Microbotryomycetes sp. JL201]|nr:hypothetical protein OIV83_006066 [Microbotryomycetes sp. JL201]
MSQTIWPNNSNQAMLFESPHVRNLPAFLTPLLDKVLPAALEDLPAHVYDIIFKSELPRQGISRHVDLATRFEDGIVGISLCGSTVMEFERQSTVHALLLRPGDVLVLSGEARWQWKHGIAYRHEDTISEDGDTYTLCRRTRMSITLRRLQTGADLVGN